MIAVAKFRNFKALQCVDVELAPLTVFVGPNGSGKTSILEGIYLVSQIGHKSPRKLFVAARSPCLLATGRLPKDGPFQFDQMELSLRLTNENEMQLEFDLPANRNSGFDLLLKAKIGDSPFEHSIRGFALDSSRDSQIPSIVKNAVLLRLSADEIAKPSYSRDSSPRVEFNGEGTASMLAHLKLADDPGYAQIVEGLQSLVPTVTGIRLKPTQVEKVVMEEVTIGDETRMFDRRRTFPGHEVLFDTQAGERLPGSLMSEGTLFCLGLLTILYSPSRPELILLDDLGSCLHPKAQKQVIDIIRQVQRENPALQVVATSHSPYLLDCLQPEEVRVTTLDENGYQLCAKLGDHPEFEKWKEVMTPGEFWSMVGENWVTPTAEVAQ
ncbi:MAG: AAA family ATPase [Planctomycetaceae bacterium]